MEHGPRTIRMGFQRQVAHEVDIICQGFRIDVRNEENFVSVVPVNASLYRRNMLRLNPKKQENATQTPKYRPFQESRL